ncbi:MAG: SurA N-terminal domain-containing protein [Pseudomonadota bacterium]|nr:SurA N-terminal domain-containing protein [Pseudomonadota bacterium]
MVIQKMRDGTEGFLGKILIGAVVIIFGFFGYGSFSSFNSSGPKVATVNGSEISLGKFEYELQRARRALITRGVAAADIDDDSLRQTTLFQLIDREVFSQRSAEWNMQFPDTLIDKDILATAAFQTSGKFDPDFFKNSLASAGYSVERYRDELRTDKIFQQFVTGVGDSAFLTEIEAQRVSSLLAQQREVAYLEIDLGSLADKVEVQDAELKQYFDENLSEFVTEETVSIEYIELRKEDFLEMVDFDESEITRFFAENRSDYEKEERRDLSHIFLEFSTKKNRQEVRDLASNIHSRLKAGEDFAGLAKQYSEDLGSKAEGGQLGLNARGTFDPAFEEAAFALINSEFSSPIEVAAGVHIVKVNDIEAAVKPSLENIRAQVESDFKELRAEDDFYLASNRFSELLFENSDLQVPAENLGIPIKRTEPLTRSSEHPLFTNPQIVEAAFSPDVLIDGNNSDLLEIGDGRMIGLRVYEHAPAYQKDFSDVSQAILELVMQQKSSALSEKIASDMIDQIEGGSLAQYVADQAGYSWTVLGPVTPSQQGINPYVLSAAFKIPRPTDNSESLGIAILMDGSSAVIRVSSVETDQVGAAGELADEIKNVFGRQRGFDEIRYFQKSLRDSSDVDLSS